MRSALLLTLLLPALARADEPPKDFAAWEELYQFECNGPFTALGTPDVRVHRGWRYEFKGGTATVRREGSDGKAPKSGVKLGVLAGIKDLEPDTRETLTRFLAEFEKADVEAILIGGDTAETPEQLDAIYAFLVEATARPLLTVAGNTERPGAHTYAINKLRKAGHHHLINMDVVRRYDGAGFDVASLAGYYDKRYLHLSGGCVYTDAALTDLESAAKAADDPVVLLAHGPMKQSGKAAIDFVPGAGNVGDQRLTDLIRRAKIPFGTFGHIIEAGGHATDLAGKSLPPKKPLPALYLDQGSCNPLPWKMNDGTTSYGLAAVLTITGKLGSYEILRSPRPPPAPAE